LCHVAAVKRLPVHPHSADYIRGFISHVFVGPGPVIFGEDQLISASAGPPDQLFVMFTAERIL
ncbi:MAG: hypothetical protein AB2693_21040, partial [Candidatus Thiodiazotropha sp.]